MPKTTAKHSVTSTDQNVRGYPGTVARCICGWSDAWAVRDGSAEEAGHSHLMAYDPEYKSRQQHRYVEWEQEQRALGCNCKLFEGYSSLLDPDCTLHKPPLAPSAPTHSHNCSCHISPPCWACFECRHWDHPECENDCQTCEDHEEEI